MPGDAFVLGKKGSQGSVLLFMFIGCRLPLPVFAYYSLHMFFGQRFPFYKNVNSMIRIRDDLAPAFPAETETGEERLFLKDGRILKIAWSRYSSKG